jgi:hypothetical protein
MLSGRPTPAQFVGKEDIRAMTMETSLFSGMAIIKIPLA